MRDHSTAGTAGPGSGSGSGSGPAPGPRPTAAHRGPARRSVLLGALGAGLGAALPLPARARAAGLPPIAVGDQRARRVYVLDSGTTSWAPATDTSIVRWSFSPDGDSRYADVQPQESFTYVSEVKARTMGGTPYLLTAASYGFAAVVEYGTGNRHWAGLVAPSGPGAGYNPHSIELLPGGNVAVACSGDGQVRVYNASQGPASAGVSAYPLAAAHGVHWDASLNRLWAVGDGQLVAYSLGGTDAQPALTAQTVAALPNGAHSGGHDINAVSGSSDLLWVSTGYGLYQYAKSTGTFSAYTSDNCGAQLWSGIKSVSNAGDAVLFTKPDGDLTPNWQTRYARLGAGDTASYTLADGGIYKARWWQP